MPFHTAPSLSHWLPASLSPLPHSLVVVSSTLCCLSPTPSLALSEAASEVSDTLQHSQRHRFSDAPPQQLFATVGFPLESVLLLLRNNLFFFLQEKKSTGAHWAFTHGSWYQPNYIYAWLCLVSSEDASGLMRACQGIKSGIKSEQRCEALSCCLVTF